MDKKYNITSVEKPEESAWAIIGAGIHNYNMQQVGGSNPQRLCFVLLEEDQEIVGGVIGEIHWDWLWLDLIWVREDLRGHGYGQRLLTAIEDGARNHGARNVYLDTFSFQAPGFYVKNGYHVFGELQDFPPGHQRFFLTKRL